MYFIFNTIYVIRHHRAARNTIPAANTHPAIHVEAVQPLLRLPAHRKVHTSLVRKESRKVSATLNDPTELRLWIPIMVVPT